MERYVFFFFTTSRGARFFFQTLKIFFCFLCNAGFFSLHFGFARFFSCLWTLPPLLHISNGASLTSCQLQCITPTVYGCDHTTCTRVGLFRGHTILSITITKNESPFLHSKSTVHSALASRGFASHVLLVVFLFLLVFFFLLLISISRGFGFFAFLAMGQNTYFQDTCVA